MIIFTPNTVIKSADINTNFAELTDIQGEWTAYTPTIAADGGSPVIGNSTSDCAYIQIGKTVIGRFSITLGSTGSFGTGTVYWSLPVTAKTLTKQGAIIGHCYVEDLATLGTVGWLQKSGTGFLYVTFQTTAGTGRQATLSGSVPVPFSWGAGDFITGTFTYEAA